MHTSGAAMRNEQIRDGEVIRVGSIDYYLEAYDQSGSQVVQQEPFQVLPGDTFRTVCTYSSSTPGQTFGLSTQEEMCIAFLLYYPAKTVLGQFAWTCAANVPFPTCEEEYSSRELTEVANRTFGTPNLAGMCPSDADNTPDNLDTPVNTDTAGEPTTVSDVDMVDSFDNEPSSSTTTSDAAMALFGKSFAMSVAIAFFLARR